MLPLALSLLAGCSAASTQYKSRPFFLTEEEVATHGRKACYDRVVELDPGRAEFTVVADYQQAPPKRIAVLPFTDLGQDEYVVDKLPLLPRSDPYTRYSTNVTPAIDPIDIVINSALNIVELRHITLARAEHEVGREIVLRLPVAEHNVSDFKTEAVEQEAPADRKSLTISTWQSSPLSS